MLNMPQAREFATFIRASCRSGTSLLRGGALGVKLQRAKSFVMKSGSGPPSSLSFNDRDQLKGWLRTQSREICIGIAMRAALRVLVLTAQVAPCIDTRYGLGGFRRSIFLLFRATALARIAVICPARAEEFGPQARAVLNLFASGAAAMTTSCAFTLVTNSASAAIYTYAAAFSAARSDVDAYSAAFAATQVAMKPPPPSSPPLPPPKSPTPPTARFGPLFHKTRRLSLGVARRARSHLGVCGPSILPIGRPTIGGSCVRFCQRVSIGRSGPGGMTSVWLIAFTVSQGNSCSEWIRWFQPLFPGRLWTQIRPRQINA